VLDSFSAAVTKYLKKNNLEEERLILAQSFKAHGHWLHCFGPEARQNSIVTGASDKGGCLPRGSQEAEREREKAKDNK
jgi:hypothetical protein